ncbi:ABC transporter ATP-binding protein [Paenibacillus humicola]|uniref:ATP-binding cassette domain-containing protein n=1 Tax=Paenibacillus humicola TaxID=3110540 RepID=UPI00237A87CE|nr:ABC transporter ATP-binding protein [Paenibacillus humicola]
MLELHQVIWRHSSSDFRIDIPRLTFKTGITLLVGRNGAGKSSLLRLLATAQFPGEGEIRYNGLTAERDLPVIRSQIGFVPTGLELYEEMKPPRLLRYLAELKGGAAAGELEELADAFGLSGYAGRKIKTLPQGVRQRIALSQAWIGSPAFLFLDEPLNALDALERLRFIRFVAARSSGRTVIVSAHELNEWETWADRVLWLDGGRVRFYGTLPEWSEGLPLSIWEGTVGAAEYAALDRLSVLHIVSQVNRTFRVRLMSAVCPGPQFVPRETSLEDAYFIRCRLQRLTAATSTD